MSDTAAHYLLTTFAYDGRPSLKRCSNPIDVVREAALRYINTDEPWHENEVYFCLTVKGDGDLKLDEIEQKSVMSRVMQEKPIWEEDEDES